MRRREFITLLGGAVAWPLAARAAISDAGNRVPQHDLPRNIRLQTEAFREGLRKLGYVEGQNVSFDN